MKKNILALALSLGLFSGLISCFCKQDNPYWVLEKFTIEFLDNQYNPIFSDTIEVDTLNLQITPTAIFVAQITNKFNMLVVNTANALQCPSPIEYGFKSRLSGIKVISNEPFNNFSADENLISICKINDMDLTSFIDSQPINPYQNIRISLLSKPTQSIQRNFSVYFEFENGSVVSVSSPQLVWE